MPVSSGPRRDVARAHLRRRSGGPPRAVPGVREASSRPSGRTGPVAPPAPAAPLLPLAEPRWSRVACPASRAERPLSAHRESLVESPVEPLVEPLVPVPSPPLPVGTAPGRRYRLDRRGRLVRSALLLMSAVALVLHLATGSGGSADTAVPAPPVEAAGTAASAAPSPAVRHVLVLPGDTLWGIAADVAPRVDRRDAVAQLREANGLVGSGVVAGQRLLVPAALLR